MLGLNTFFSTWSPITMCRSVCGWRLSEKFHATRRLGVFHTPLSKKFRQTNMTMTLQHPAGEPSLSVRGDGRFILSTLITQCATGVQPHPAPESLESRWGCLTQSSSTHTLTVGCMKSNWSVICLFSWMVHCFTCCCRKEFWDAIISFSYLKDGFMYPLLKEWRKEASALPKHSQNSKQLLPWLPSR